MITINTPSYKDLKDKLTVKKPWDMIIIFIINVLITIPLFLILHQNLINLNWVWHLDRIIIIITLLASIQFLLAAMRRITLILVFCYLLILVFGSLFGTYNFAYVFQSYQSMLYSMTDNPYPQDIIIDKLLPFPNKNKVLNAIEFDNPRVRNFTIMAANKNFKDIKGYEQYRTIIQCFAVFKEINSNWNYIHDPKGQDYIAKASESLRYLSGDCDDHSILMAACVRSIGGTPRLIHTDGHIYPEILIGKKSDLEIINYLIKKSLFATESKGKPINYHIDERGQVWLNLDYTAKFPGGPFMSEEILGALTLN
ncbi:transglutaminase [Flavobacterium sp.]|uniref:transglutaminase n=1 Tax=Flavobacterium sp. TaxID=239 RepID=UPI0037529471